MLALKYKFTKKGNLSLEPEQSALLNHLHGATKERPALRPWLRERTGWGERRVRDVISDLQAQGFWVISLGKGYYITESKEELLAYKKREQKRAKNILWKLSRLFPELREVHRQMEMSFL